MGSKFKDWKCRASSLGHIMTSLPSKEDIEKTKSEIKILENERDLGINVNGNKVKWTDNKAEKLTSLKVKLNTKDELPTGAKTFLDGVFNDVYWKRKESLNNKYLQKGLIMEDDGLALISELDGVFYIKNKERVSNDYTEGECDNNQDIIRDIKNSWSKQTFDNAKESNLYKWQIKDYCWMYKKQKGELDYCLLNNPEHQITEEIKSKWFKLGCPDDEDEEWIELRCQIERNMIFDIKKFKRDYPNYQFENKVLDFDIHPACRVKRFQFSLEPEDIKNIKSRVVLAREYLMKKEQEVLDKIKEFESVKK